MKFKTLAGLMAAPVLVFALALPSAAETTCKDGTTTTSTGKGTCSGHGGVQKSASTTAAPAAAPEKPAAPAAAAAAPAAAAPAAPAAAKSSTATKSAPAATGNTSAAGATAKCKDGTYSKSAHHSGTCSKHGGVAEWLDGSK
jgi:hypothetical protein